MMRHVLKTIALYIVYIFEYIKRISLVREKKPRFPRKPNQVNMMHQNEFMRYTARLTLDQIIYQKMEDLVERMNNKTTGVFMNTNAVALPKGILPPVFRGKDLIKWMVNNMNTSEVRALYLANVMASHGYMFSIDDHHLKVENTNNKYYRFQTPYYWYSNLTNPKEYDYAIYLTKRSMEQQLELKLDDYEAKYLEKLKVIYYKNWLYVNMQAEAELNMTKKHNNSDDKQILDSQERAFWDLHRPMPNVETKKEFDHEKLMSFKEISKWNIRNVLRSHINIAKETAM